MARNNIEFRVRFQKFLLYIIVYVLAKRSTELTNNYLSDLWIGICDIYRILQSFLIIPHILAAPFLPWPWFIDPAPVFTRRGVKRIDCKRTIEFGIFLQSTVTFVLTLFEESKCFLIAWMRIQEKLCFIDGKTYSIYPVKQFLPASARSIICHY